jgi:hypothetical protein
MIISDEEVIMANVDPKDYLLGDAAIQPEPYPLATDNVTVLPGTEEDDQSTVFDNWFLSIKQLMDLPKPDPLIDGWLDKGTLGTMYGPPKAGKSFAALDMALCVASGSHWHGHAVTKQKVLYIAGEGIAYYPPRVRAWMQVNNVHQSAEENFTILSRAVHLNSVDQAHELTRAIKRDGYKFIIIDTLARAMAGSDENSNTEMSLVVGTIDLMMAETKSTALIVHHTGKDPTKGLRGASALLGAVDSSILVTKGQPGEVTITSEDQRGRESGAVLRLKLQKETGVPEDEAGAALVKRDAINIRAEEDNWKHCERTLSALYAIDHGKGASSTDWLANAADLYKNETGDPISRSTFNRHRKLLVKKNQVHQITNKYFHGPEPEEE